MSDYTPRPLAKDRPLWEQQPDESNRFYAYFLCYRDAGLIRTLAKAAKTLTRSAPYIRQVARRYQWTDRVSAWDKHEKEQWSLQMMQRRREMADEHAEVANSMMKQVVGKLDTMDCFLIREQDLPRWVEIAVKVKRAAYGEPETTLGVSGPDGGPIVVESMNVADLRKRMAALRAEMDTRIPVDADAT